VRDGGLFYEPDKPVTVVRLQDMNPPTGSMIQFAKFVRQDVPESLKKDDG
jgi:hypothetical protein